jgi:hypothetical protein
VAWILVACAAVPGEFGTDPGDDAGAVCSDERPVSSSEFASVGSGGAGAPWGGISCLKTEFSSASTQAGLGELDGASNSLVSELVPPGIGKRRTSKRKRIPAFECNSGKGNKFSSKTTSREI